MFLSFKGSLCISDNSPLSDIFYKCFLPVCGCLLVLLLLSFTEQMFLILMKSHLSMSSFIKQAFGVLFIHTYVYIL